MVWLGNNFATTEADIVAFSTRIAGAGAIAGMTEADLAGIGAAFSSVGVQAEAGGTAVQKVLIDINTSVAMGGSQLEKYAQAAGMISSRRGLAQRSRPGIYILC
ncbi:MAG: phage tail tape measure protein [Candidatus Promineofilum sp.]|nr:phage tail tape measure protein [Promineifilum sp.]